MNGCQGGGADKAVWPLIEREEAGRRYFHTYQMRRGEEGESALNAIERRRNELRAYTPPLTRTAEEVEAFWQPRLAAAARRPLNVRRERTDAELFGDTAVYRVTYDAHDGTAIGAWFIVPPSAAGQPLPCVVLYPGYSTDRGYPERHAKWLLAGCCVFAVDARGQGGETGNGLTSGSGQARGWMTQGLLDPEGGYYAALLLDAVRAVEAAAEMPEVDAARVASAGGSQGGGLALAAAALGRRVCAVAADIPNLCHLDYAVMHSTGSVSEVADYVSRHPERLDEVLERLSYYDMMNLAYRIEVPVLMSVGWKDPVCPPETVYAAYNRLTVPKTIRDYPFLGHQVPEYQGRETLLFLRERFRVLRAMK